MDAVCLINDADFLFVLKLKRPTIYTTIKRRQEVYEHMQFSTETNQNQNILTICFSENPVSVKRLSRYNWNDEHIGRKGCCENTGEGQTRRSWHRIP